MSDLEWMPGEWDRVKVDDRVRLVNKQDPNIIIQAFVAAVPCVGELELLGASRNRPYWDLYVVKPSVPQKLLSVVEFGPNAVRLVKIAADSWVMVRDERSSSQGPYTDFGNSRPAIWRNADLVREGFTVIS